MSRAGQKFENNSAPFILIEQLSNFDDFLIEYDFSNHPHQVNFLGIKINVALKLGGCFFAGAN